MNWLLREIPLPPFSTRVLGLLLFFVVYFYVPTVNVCERGLQQYRDLGLTYFMCERPAFTVQCVASSQFFRGTPVAGEYLCRTWWHRPVRVVVDTIRQREICESTMGWLSDHDPDRGCYCSYYSAERHGVCVMTDEACRELFGSGATAYVSDEDLGYPDQCARPQ